MIEGVVSVSELVAEPMKSELDKWFRVRELTLAMCSALPGYGTLGRKEANKIYDHVKAKIAEQMEEAASNEQT